ncbi:MAG: DUF397 domain-containing protein [Actinophytocola sp.]|uniref:DUF397 domain-containing protein n=1 Tax=Actinophytocola sp. TaxID=1872138 RepID=UPI0013212C3D|nr:DUF397 domain-containing protein [Actinophytocola sp.]MPZ80258.1 DUF397 domain-containing protein [Actinophytocola sp.]
MPSVRPESSSWRKSSYSNVNDCVELAWPAEGGAVRDSKNVTGPTLTVARAGLTGLIAATRSGALGR